MGALLGAFFAGSGAGAAGAWWAHRRTRLSAWNFYALVPAGALAWGAALASREPSAVVGAALLVSAGVTGAGVARRYRLSALGAGGELREFERSRRMAWSLLGSGERRRRSARRDRGERTRIVGQGELVRERAWPEHEPAVPMTADGRGLLPRREGRHLLIVGATGSGKTVSARRWLLARVLADGVSVLVTDPKGDRGLERDVRAASRLVRRPLIVFDPRDPVADRWNPLWSDDIGAVVSRLVAPIGAGDGNARYYADLLQIHLGTVAAGLRAAGLWPANLPLLLDAAQLNRYDALLKLVRASAGEHADITARMREHRATVATPEGRRDLTGGILRLRVVAGETWRTVLTPDPERGAITLPTAMVAGALVLVRTWVDDLPDEARAITTLFLADAAAAALALPEGTQWAALIDEFGGVLSTGAGERALALMQRARSAGGQVAVTTQSVTDFAAATGNPALLDALADNFAAGIFHLQSSPESRDWLARLVGTREVWQSTDRTVARGAAADGVGTRRRVREFLMRPDELRLLNTGEAYIWSTLGPDPERVQVAPALLPAPTGAPVDASRLYVPCGPTRLPASASVPSPPDQPRRGRTSAASSLEVVDEAL
ncbi:type IV secretory system conjugative DNA transfer family protein [Solirubrobacter pauli]|uniref:type IV secretory system conjugative DNA transfer family protein n=1 Tax=Solirubrobacter pauli TaxID=166793 RepID=UPI001476EA01|nr:helicase HerA-like domain-containing protein [Solirubrobacter pauli]